MLTTRATEPPPLWRDPRYQPEHRLRQIEAHEQAIRQREHEREHRRLTALLVKETGFTEDPDFPGCIW